MRARKGAAGAARVECARSDPLTPFPLPCPAQSVIVAAPIMVLATCLVSWQVEWRLRFKFLNLVRGG